MESDDPEEKSVQGGQFKLNINGKTEKSKLKSINPKSPKKIANFLKSASSFDFLTETDTETLHDALQEICSLGLVIENEAFNRLVINAFLELGDRPKMLIGRYSSRSKFMHKIHCELMKMGAAIDPNFNRQQCGLASELLLCKSGLNFDEKEVTMKYLYEQCVEDAKATLKYSGALDNYVDHIGKLKANRILCARITQMIIKNIPNFSDGMNLATFSSYEEEAIPFICYDKQATVGDERKANIYPFSYMFSTSELIREHLDTDKNRFCPSFGEIYFNHYIAIYELGSGGYSSVWLGWHITKHIFVAMKFVPINELDQLTEFTVHFEINKNKPSHCTYLEDLFILTNLKEKLVACAILSPVGEDLAEVCHKRMNDEDHLKNLSQVVIRELDFLHRECQVLHGDIKPSNILVEIPMHRILATVKEVCNEELSSSLDINGVPDSYIGQLNKIFACREIAKHTRHFNLTHTESEDRNTFISDFGLSLHFKNHPKHIKGLTKNYSSPEALEHAEPSVTMDIWSLGCALYELAAGRKCQGMFLRSQSRFSYFIERNRGLEFITANEVRGTILERFGLGHMDLSQTILRDLRHLIWPIQDKMAFAHLVAGMLLFEPDDRPTLEKCLTHPWFH